MSNLENIKKLDEGTVNAIWEQLDLLAKDNPNLLQQLTGIAAIKVNNPIKWKFIISKLK